MSNVARALDDDGADECRTGGPAAPAAVVAAPQPDLGLVLSLIVAICLLLYAASGASPATAVAPVPPPCAGTGIVDALVSGGRYPAAVRCVTLREAPVAARHPA